MDQDRPQLPIRFQRPEFPASEEIERHLAAARRERWLSNGGPCWRLLRDRLADRVGAYCLPVASATTGLMIAIAAVCGRTDRRGGRAAMPSFTFPATAQAALWAGLEPQLLDIEQGGWHLDPAQLERAVHRDPEIAVALAVTAFGTPLRADVRRRLEQACHDAGVPLVIDSAAGFGASAEDGTPIGAGGDVEVVSFHATKPFAIGEGGAVFTRHKDVYERLEAASNFGYDRDHVISSGMALNGKMSELHAATALAVLDRIDEIVATRRGSAAAVRALADPAVGWQDGCERSTWQFMPVAFADSGRRARVLEACGGRIEARTYYEPLHTQPPLREKARLDGALEKTEDLYSRVLCLPMANDLSPAEVELIGAVLSPAALGARREVPGTTV